MSTILAREQTVDPEVLELRKELTDLQSAMAALVEEMAESRQDEAELDRHRAMLAEAQDVQAVLTVRLTEVEAELEATRAALSRQSMVSAIRAKLLLDIDLAGWWRRGAAMRRAARVERLLRISGSG